MGSFVTEYAKLVPAYLAVAWQTAEYFYDPRLAAGLAVVVIVCLLLRVFLGGIGGKLVRFAVYVGLFYLVSRNEQFRALFPETVGANIIAAILVGGLWLPVTVLGGIIRALYRRGNDRVPTYAGTPGHAAAAPAGGQSFDIKRPDNEKKQFMVIMMTDIVGYSARMEKDEAATYALLKDHNTIMRRAISAHRGREIKTIGDAFMVVFDNPLDALRCGIAMQDELHKFNKPRLVNDQLKVRIGIHRDEVILTGKDVFGEGVNIAARMESITEPGGISISAGIYEQVKNKVEAGFQSIGVPKMKNIANPPEVYRVQISRA